MVGWVSGWVLEGLGGGRGHFRRKFVSALGGLLLEIVNGKDKAARIALCKKHRFQRGGFLGGSDGG